MSFIITIIALSVVIFIHELGHLLAAKWAKIGVYEFAIGMGPKLIGRRWGETEYTIRLLPIGGFVKLAGMDDSPENTQFSTDQDLYSKKPFPRFVTISAGSVFNILLGFIIFVVVYTGFGVHLPSTVIDSVVTNTPASQVDIRPGDRIISLNNIQVNDNGVRFMDALQQVPPGQILVQIRRGSEIRDIHVAPIQQNHRWVIGVLFKLSDTPTHFGPLKAVKWGLKTTMTSVEMVFYSVKMMATGAVKPKEMAGLVGIVQMAAYGYNQGFDSFLKFIAMISISLGVFNLFPLPALDGGHLAFLAIEVVRGKPLNRKWETIITNTGFALLMALMVFILANDVIHWTDRNKVLHSTSSPR
jgi:regulator of sigma E protease